MRRLLATPGSGPNSFTSTVEDPTILTTDAAFPGPGSHTYTVTVTDANGCTDEASVIITVGTNPSVTATSSPAICGDAPIILDATGTAGSVGITAYQWSGPSGFTSNVEDPTINPGSGSYPAAGIHTYTVTVTDANGCTGTATVDVEIWATPSVSAASSGSICSDVAINLDATGTQGTGAITGYNWTGPNGFVSTTEDPTILNTDAAWPGVGTHVYNVTVTDANGCTGTDQVSVTVWALPSVTTTSAPTVCNDESIILNATGTAGSASIAGYNWSGPNGFTSTSEDPTILSTDAAWPGAGAHTYSVTVTDGNGCTATSSVDVEVFSNPAVTATAGAGTQCDDAAINLDATGTAGSGTITGYSWSGPLSYSSIAEDPVILTTDASYPGVGTFTYTVTVTDDNGCTGTASVEVTINGTPSVTAGGSTSVCDEENITLTATGLAGSAAITGYAWSGPNGFTSTVEDPTILSTDAAFPGPGSHTYNVTVTDANGCTDEASVLITVGTNPSVTATSTPAICGDAPIVLDATGTAGSVGITDYAWSGPNGFTSALQDPTINPGSGAYPSAGIHTYTVTVTDANGCTGTATVDVEVWATPTVVAASSGSVCSDTSIDLDATGTAGTGVITGYNWTGPNGFVSSAEDPTILITDAEWPGVGTHVYNVTVTDANGCTGTDQVSVTVWALPAVSASSAPAVCNDASIALAATGTAGSASITGYNWTGPNGFTSSTEDPTILSTDAAWPGVGVHTYFVTVTDGNGCTATASVDVEVFDNPTVTATSATDQCDDAPILLDATGTAGSGTITGYAWSGPLSYASTAEDPTINITSEFYPGVGTFTYTVTVTDDNGCTGTASVDVTINGTPTVTAGGSTNVCGDENISLTATGLPGSAAITGYAWSGPNSFTSTVEDPTILTTDAAFPGAGTHTYNVTVTDANGCTDEDSVQITVGVNPSVTATSTPAICGDAPIVLDATGTAGSVGITDYAWSGPNGFTSALQDPTITPGSGSYPSAGIHTYTVTVTDANGCTGTATVDVEVWATPTVAAASSGSVCSDTSIDLDATGTAGTGAITGYNWSGPNGFTSTTEDPTILITDGAWPGVGTHVYNVTVTDANGCSGTDQVSVTVWALPGVAASSAPTGM